MTIPDPPPLASIPLVDILEDIPEIAFIYRADGLLVGLNRACERLIMVPREVVLGHFNLYQHTAELSPELVAGYAAAFRGQSQIIPATAVRFEGLDVADVALKVAARWFETLLVPLHRGPDGTAAYVLGIQRDVTELIAAREEIAAGREEIAAAQAKIGAQQDIIASLEAAQSEIEQQKATIQALATPVIEVWDGIITLPLLGHFNAERASEMTSHLLDAVVRTQARYAILDLTGLSVIDEATGDHILRIVKAVGLLGAIGVLVGIQAEIARMLVGVGVDLGRIRVHQNLRQALKACMAERGA